MRINTVWQRHLDKIGIAPVSLADSFSVNIVLVEKRRRVEEEKVQVSSLS